MTPFSLSTSLPGAASDALGIAAALDAADERFLSIVSGLTPAQGHWRPRDGEPCVCECIEHYAEWLHRTVPVLRDGVVGVRSAWRARLGRVHSGWWWRLLPRLVEHAPDWLLDLPLRARRSHVQAQRPLRAVMSEVLSMHGELRHLAVDGARRDLRTATVQLPGLGPLPCPLDVAMAMVPAVFRRLLRRAERVRLEWSFPLE